MPFILGAFKHFGKQFQRVLWAQGDNRKLSQSPLWQGKFNLVVHPAPTGVCPQHPTHPSFPRSSITLSAFLWLLLMKHSGLRNEARPKASHSPCHKTDTGPALAAARGGAGGCSCSAPTGRKALQSYFYPRHCRTRSSSRQLSVFFLFFPLLVSCLRSIPREPGQRSCFGRRGLRS